MARQKIQDSISEARRFLNTSLWFTPVNLNEEREKFLSSSVYNPHFKYPGFPKNEAEDYYQQLSKLVGEENTATLEKLILSRKIKETVLKLKLVLSRGQQNLSQVSQELYQCHFDRQTLDLAKNDASIEGEFESMEDIEPPEIIEGIKKYLENYDINDWNVELSENTDFYIRIQSSKKNIIVSKRFNWDFCDFDNTLAHEIDGHVIRAVNAQKQENPLFQKPLPFYIKTEEGLASFLGDYISTTADISRKHHALKYLAGHLALTNSFRKVFNYLVDNGFTKDLAFQRTFRLKRGYEDTSAPGVFAKEAMYYEGMIEVKDFLDSGGEVKKLYAGKIGLTDLEYIPIPKEIIIPERLKDYLNK
jgi:hypothetical protein